MLHFKRRDARQNERVEMHDILFLYKEQSVVSDQEKDLCLLVDSLLLRVKS